MVFIRKCSWYIYYWGVSSLLRLLTDELGCFKRLYEPFNLSYAGEKKEQTSRLANKDWLENIWVIDQAWGQDGWILAKFFFCALNTQKQPGQYPAILTATSLVNKGQGPYPEQLHLARSHSQSQREIWFLPAHGTSHIIKNIINLCIFFSGLCQTITFWVFLKSYFSLKFNAGITHLAWVSFNKRKSWSLGFKLHSCRIRG